MNILFFVLKTKLLKNGEAPVLMRITINGDYDDARIQRSVPLNLWNAAKGCSKGRDRASVALNTYIAELHARALEKHKELVFENGYVVEYEEALNVANPYPMTIKFAISAQTVKMDEATFVQDWPENN